MQNPRVLLLFRFVSDIMRAVSIIGATAAKAQGDKGSKQQEEPQQGQQGQHGGGGGSAEACAAPACAGGGGGSKGASLEVVVQLRNVGLVVPCSAKGRSALGGQVDHLLIALPGALCALTGRCLCLLL